MNTLYDLVKKIDALTANSQQVLNALIRSCVASGSSSGYKINKYGVEIELSRADIYHLYDFYQSWEAAGFPTDEADFDSLLARADERWRVNASDTSTLASDAVTKHAKILYLTKEQATKLTDEKTKESAEAQWNTDYWVARVRDSASPKGIVSSAPIPLNLRTPLYDENLSVKSFSQFETYLFPMGYHRADILGTPGNGEDYIAGGRNWTIDASDFLTLSGNHILLGINSMPDNKLESYDGKYTSISWGNESYAFGNNSLAFGDHSIASANHAIVFGRKCNGQGVASFIAGGTSDATVKANGFATNWLNTAVAENSFAANHNNFGGGWGYGFTFIGSESNVVRTDCEVQYIESDNICVTNDPSTVFNNSSLYKVIKIPASEVNYACMPFDMKKDDYIVLYNLYVNNEQGYPVQACDIDGYSALPHIARINEIARVNKADSDELDYYEITLSSAVPVTSRYGLFVGGTVSLSLRMLQQHDIDGNNLAIKQIEMGENSSAFGHANAAIGRNQMVVGQMSVPNLDAKFVVGVGSYISDENPYRSNALVVGDTYSYMKLANGKSYIGMSTAFRNVGDMGPGMTDSLTLYRGTIMVTEDPDTDAVLSVTTDYDQAFLHASKANNQIARIGAGVHMHPFFDSDYPTSLMQSLQGTAIIASGAYIESTQDGETTKLNLVDTLLDQSPVIRTETDHGIGIYAEDGIDIRNISTQRGINVDTCSYLTMTFKGLLLTGQTFGALAATDKSRSFMLDKNPDSDNNGHLDSILWGHTTGASGFYFIDGPDSNSKLYQTDEDVTMGMATKYDSQILHLFNSAQRSGIDEKLHVASLSVPEQSRNDIGGALRPKVITGTIDGVGGDEGKVITSKEIPYADDISVWSSAPASCFGYRKDDTSGTLVAAGDVGDGSYAYMPLLRLIRQNSVWKWEYNGLYACIKVIPAASHPAYLYRYHAMEIDFYTTDTSVRTTPFGRMVVSASINGNVVDMYGNISFEEDETILPENSIDGFRIPFIPGFATHSSVYKFGHPTLTRLDNSIYRLVNGYLVSNLVGRHFANGDLDEMASINDDDEIKYSGVGVQPGILAVDIFKCVGSVIPWSHTKPYRFHVHGMVPFEATTECIGANIDNRWNNAMAACYSGKAIMPPSTLATIMKEA